MPKVTGSGGRNGIGSQLSGFKAYAFPLWQAVHAYLLKAAGMNSYRCALYKNVTWCHLKDRTLGWNPWLTQYSTLVCVCSCMFWN